MSLREMIIERIRFALDESTLENTYSLYGNDLEELSDLDLLELYEGTLYEDN